MILLEKYGRLKKYFNGHQFWAGVYLLNTADLNEAEVQKCIQNKAVNETDLSNPF